nr:MAG TPA: hypothetical protein [Caudoviricetes sp.]
MLFLRMETISSRKIQHCRRRESCCLGNIQLLSCLKKH